KVILLEDTFVFAILFFYYASEVFLEVNQMAFFIVFPKELLSLMCGPNATYTCCAGMCLIPDIGSNKILLLYFNKGDV
ncbi:hypothetical protein ACQP3D_29245, partial [Escherichia coli]